MASFTVNLTPSLVTIATEGSLDTTVVNGLSNQRTFEMTMVKNSGNGRKIVSRIPDGGTYDDVTTYVNLYENDPGHPTFTSGTPVSRSAITSGHPTSSSNSGSTL
jgi:hypothetical protein